MDRKGVEDILLIQLSTSMRLNPFDEFHEQFKTWLTAVENDAKKIREGKHNGLVMPTTPAASRGFRHRLSVIRESPAVNATEQTTKSHLKLSKVTNDQNRSLKTRQLSKTRFKLTFHLSDEESVDHDCVENHSALENPSSQDSSKTCGTISQAFNSGSSEQCLAEIQEKIRGDERRGSRSQPENCNEREKEVIHSQRNTRNSVKISRNASCDTGRHSVDMSLPNSQSSISESLHESRSDLINEKQSISKGNRRTKNSSVVSSKKRITSSRKSKAKASLRIESYVSSPVPVDVTSTNSRMSVSESENTDEFPVVKKLSTAGKKGRLKNHSSVRSKMRVTGAKKITRSIARTLGSLNSSVLVSESSNNTSPLDCQDKTEKLSSKTKNTDVDMEKKSLQNIDKTKINTSIIEICENDSSDSTYVQKINNNSQISISKEMVVCLTRIDETLGNLSHTAKISEESFHGYKGCDISNILKKSVIKSSEETEKTFPEEVNDGNRRKRSLSCLEISRPSKRSRLFGKDRNLAENDIKDQNTRSSQRLSLQQKNSISPFALPETEIKNSSIFKEVISFSEITSPTSISSARKIQTLEDIVANSEEKKEDVNKENTNSKANSGKGNSIDSEVECSEYYSVGSKADTVDFIEGSQENVNTCIIPVLTSQSERKQSLRKQSEKPLTKPKTPDTRGSRNGAHAALFSPYANEPVKNRVAAYEVLSSVVEEVEIPITTKRVTRTKTRAMVAAAAAAAAAANATGASDQKHLFNNSNTKSGRTQKFARASMWRAKKKLALAAKRNDASKENSFNSSAKSAISGKPYNFTPLTGSKILADLNGLSSSQLNSSRKTPMSVSRLFVPPSGNQSSKSTHKAGVILGNIETFIKRNVKPDIDPELKKLEEQKKREEKEREAQRRREEFLKKQAEDKKKKRDEMRQRVQEKREAQEKQKQESQLRVGREKDEKWNILQQEREAKQKGNLMKKKLEAEKKAAEARRKAEEAEAARLHKMKMEEQLRLKELEEAEKERQRRIADEREAVLLREKMEHVLKKAAEVKETNKQINISNSQAEDLTFKKPLNNTFTKIFDTTFTKPLDTSSSGSQNTTFNLPLPEKQKTHKKINNAYDLENLPSDDSDDEADDPPKKTAHWASKSRLLFCTEWEHLLDKFTSVYFHTPKTINFSEIFPNRRAFKRTSSAIWNTPPRYSCLPKY